MFDPFGGVTDAVLLRGGGLPLAGLWSSGGYWDFRTLSDDPGTTLTSTIASAEGSNVITPVASPIIEDTGISGRKAVYLDVNALQYLRCDALASLVNGNDAVFTVIVRARRISAGGMTLFACGDSTSATTNYFRLKWSSLNAVEVSKEDTVAGSGTVTGDIDLQYNEHTIAAVVNGTSITIYVDGVADPMSGGSTIDVAALSTDRACFGNSLSTGNSALFDGYMQACAILPVALTAEQVQLVTNAWVAGAFTLPLASSPRILWSGDSIMEGTHSSPDAAGWRYLWHLYQYRNKLSFNSIGANVAGKMPNRENEGNSGQTLSSIANTAETLLGSTSAKVVFFVGGTNNVDSGATQDHLDAYEAAIADICTAAEAADSAAVVVVSSIPPNNSSPSDVNTPPFNAGLPALWDAQDLLNSNALVRWDCEQCMGINGSGPGTYDASEFDDNTHPNALGHQVSFFNATDGLLPAIHTLMRSLSPTIAPMAVHFLSPAPGATVVAGTPVTVSGRCSRTTCSVDVAEFGASVIGSADAGDYLTLEWSYDWTPQSADVGSFTLEAQASDDIDSSTATATLAVTVEESALPLDNWLGYWDADDVSDAGGGVITFNDQSVSGNDLTTSDAATSTTTMTGSRATVDFNGTTDSYAEADAIATSLSGSNTPYSRAMQVQIGSVVNNDTLMTFGKTTGVAPYDLLRMVTGFAFEVQRDGDSGADTGAIDAGTPTTAEWFILQSFNGSTVTVWVAEDGGTLTKIIDAQAYTTNICTFDTVTFMAWNRNGAIANNTVGGMRKGAIRSTSTSDAEAATLYAAWNDRP